MTADAVRAAARVTQPGAAHGVARVLRHVSRAAASLLLLGACCVAGALAQSQGPVVTSLTLFAGNAEGLWRSRDWGGSWQRVQSPAFLELGSVHVVQPLGPLVHLGADGGLFASDDFGETWKRLSDLTGVRALQVSRYPAADPTVFVGTAAGLLKSVDAGATFRPAGIEGPAITRLYWPGPALVAATSSGVRRSDDGAQTWQAPSQGLPEGAVGGLALSSYFAVDPVLFAGVGSQGVHRSTDGGRTWSPSGLPGRRVNDLVWLGPLLYAATDGGLFRGEDAGSRWTRIGEGLGEAVVASILFPLAPDSGAEAFVATDRGIFRTLDGGLRFERTGFRDAATLVATFPPPEPVRRKR